MDNVHVELATFAGRQDPAELDRPAACSLHGPFHQKGRVAGQDSQKLHQAFRECNRPNQLLLADNLDAVVPWQDPVEQLPPQAPLLRGGAHPLRQDTVF